MAEVDLIKIQLNLKDHSMDFSVPAAADDIIRSRPHDVLAMLEKLAERLGTASSCHPQPRSVGGSC